MMDYGWLDGRQIDASLSPLSLSRSTYLGMYPSRSLGPSPYHNTHNPVTNEIRRKGCRILCRVPDWAGPIGMYGPGLDLFFSPSLSLFPGWIAGVMLSVVQALHLHKAFAISLCAFQCMGPCVVVFKVYAPGMIKLN
ncbi:hypothetical protein BJ166DRAFT_181280 [Pestalotiopsis sp. NC0098]|nr:hypothetical protein BJ166DRAFT_181280 [Pestalotiopsis sp. NC0098]